MQTERLTNQEEVKTLLESRKFDPETILQARGCAPQYDPHKLAEEYFAWIAASQVIPTNPRAHFLTFVKQHQKHHG